ncbi:MAG: hypothetical protein M3O50_19740 [Myxococcota bacterium]|nr:hypothetical protein [Myxococcota bacterium]
MLHLLPSRWSAFARCHRHWLRSVLASSALGLAACSKTFIPNTDVEDTGDNRHVIAFCEEYRHAMEDKNVAQLLKMMSPGYFDNGGSTRNADGADFESVRAFLTSDFLKTAGIRYEIRYRRVTFTDTRHVFVEYTYAGAWKIPGAKSDEWHHQVADNRLDLVPEGDRYKIVGGM